MEVFIELVATYAPYIYAACGLVALYQLYRLWQVRSDRRQAVFSLERERASRDLAGIFTVAMVLLLFMGGTYFSSQVLATAVATETPEGDVATPEELPDDLIVNLIITPTPLPMTPSPTPTATETPIAPTATPDPLNQPTPDPNAPATPTPAPVAAPVAAPANCPDARALISSPGAGASVSGSIALQGTANHESFSYYKINFAPGAILSYQAASLRAARLFVDLRYMLTVDTEPFATTPLQGVPASFLLGHNVLTKVGAELPLSERTSFLFSLGLDVHLRPDDSPVMPSVSVGLVTGF